jgi:hypothetical protein
VDVLNKCSWLFRILENLGMQYNVILSRFVVNHSCHKSAIILRVQNLRLYSWSFIMQSARAVLCFHLRPVWVCHILRYYLVYDSILGKKVTEREMCFDFLNNLCLKLYSFLEEFNGIQMILCARLLCSIAHSIICKRLFRGKMHSYWCNGIEVFQGRWQHGLKVGYCYPSRLEQTLC